MFFGDRTLERLFKGLLLLIFIITPFIVFKDLFFPFVTARVYVFRALVDLAFLVWIILAIKNPAHWPRIKNPLVLSLLVFLSGLILTAFLGVDPTHSFFSNLERSDGVIQFGHWILYFLMVASVFKSRNDWLAFLWAFVATSLGVAGHAWYLHEPRLAGVFNNPSYLAGFMLFAMGMTAILWQEWQKRSAKKFWWGLFFGASLIFFAATLIFTQTRGAYLGLVAGLLLFGALSIFFRKTHRKVFIAGTGIALITLLGLASIFIFKDAPLVQENQILSRVTSAADVANIAAAKERFLSWQVAWESFKDKPLLGWGPENFDLAFNENYSFLAARQEAWFDSAHNQALDILSEGGIVLFLAYLFWIAAVFYTAILIFKRNEQFRIAAAIGSATFLAFLTQGWFLFDTFPFYLGLFPMLGFLYFAYEADELQREKTDVRLEWLRGYRVYPVLVALLLLTGFGIYELGWKPYRVNALVFQYQAQLVGGNYEEAGRYLNEARVFRSPFTNFDVDHQAAWVLLYEIDTPLPPEKKEAALGVFKEVTQREEAARQYRPLDPQLYYVLGRLYFLGFGQFGDPGYLSQAEATLKQGREIAPKRIEYMNELVSVLLAQGKGGEALSEVKEFAPTLPPPYGTLFLGHLYFLEKDYPEAARQYELAEKEGFRFWSNDLSYNRYVVAQTALKNYEAILRVSEEFITLRGDPIPHVYFNKAVALYYLGDRAGAREAYLQAVALDESFEAYDRFFTGE